MIYNKVQFKESDLEAVMLFAVQFLFYLCIQLEQTTHAERGIRLEYVLHYLYLAELDVF